MKPLKKGWLSFIAVALFFLMAGQASAAVDAYLVKENDITYKYKLKDLVQSFNTDEVLWNDFSERMMRSGVLAVYDQGRNRFVRFSALIDAFNEGIDIIEYTERDAVETVQVPGSIKLITVENSQLTYADWMASPNIPGSLIAINVISNPDLMRDALVNSAAELGLMLENFNRLNTYGKNQVATEVISKRPQGGYLNIVSLKIVFDSAAINALLRQNEAIGAINTAVSGEMMKSALSQHAAVLELEIARYNNLHAFAKDRLAAEMLKRKPFTDALAARESYLSVLGVTEANIIVTYTQYPYTLGYKADIQVGKNPQTDLYGGGWKTADRNIVEWHINPANYSENLLPAATITANNVNVRQGPATSFPALPFQLHAGNGPYFIMNQAQDSEGFVWYRIKANSWAGWVRGDLLTQTTLKGEGIFQFLVLSGTTGVSSEEINNNILVGKGILQGRAAAFIQGSVEYNINEIFLVSLALHESGNGTSVLASGVQYNGQTVYNMYGIGAIDADPINQGAKFAFEQGWFTPELAIIGGAKFASQNYINHATYKQDTLYKMRWNPAMPGIHQYATDVGWAAKQVKRVKELYELLNTYTLRFDIPLYY